MRHFLNGTGFNHRRVIKFFEFKVQLFISTTKSWENWFKESVGKKQKVNFEKMSFTLTNYSFMGFRNLSRCNNNSFNF